MNCESRRWSSKWKAQMLKTFVTCDIWTTQTGLPLLSNQAPMGKLVLSVVAILAWSVLHLWWLTKINVTMFFPEARCSKHSPLLLKKLESVVGLTFFSFFRQWSVSLRPRLQVCMKTTTGLKKWSLSKELFWHHLSLIRIKRLDNF